MTLVEFAREIGISMQMLSQILLGDGTLAAGRRSVNNDKVLAYLSPPGSHFERRDVYYLVRNGK